MAAASFRSTWCVTIGSADDLPTTHATAREEERPRGTPVIAPAFPIDPRGATELRQEDDERPFEQAALVQVVEQSRARAIDASEVPGELDDVHSPGDVAATIYHALGIHPDATLYDRQRRPNPVLPHGRMIPGMF